MIATVSLTEGTTYARAPAFRGGHPNTGGIIGLGQRCLMSPQSARRHPEYEQLLMHYALQELASVPDLTLYGPADRQGVIAFNPGNTTPMTWEASSIITAWPSVPGTTVPCR